MSHGECQITLQLRYDGIRVSLNANGVSGYAPDVLADMMKQALLGFGTEVAMLSEAGMLDPTPDA